MFVATFCKIPLSTTVTSFFAILGTALVSGELRNVEWLYVCEQFAAWIAAFFCAMLFSYLTTYLVTTQTMNMVRDSYKTRLVKLTLVFAFACAIIAEVLG